MSNLLSGLFFRKYYFKASAIVSYSPGMFAGINAAQQLRLVFAELGSPSILQQSLHHLQYQGYTRYLMKIEF
jgi:NAD(P)H-dependent FMN reductase